MVLNVLRTKFRPGSTSWRVTLVIRKVGSMDLKSFKIKLFVSNLRMVFDL